MSVNEKRMLDRETLRSVIQQWNTVRLDIFALSEPNENLEFHGVMRFYFQDEGQKVATKCIRVASDATVSDVIETLIEKFRPDMRMLSLPNYALYVVHANGEERKLNPDEKPLLVQLNWHNDDREGRFLLKNCAQKTNTLDSITDQQPSFKRKLSKREKKEQKKKEKLSKMQSAGGADSENHVAEKLYTELPETSFTRSISNPEAVMRRRRQQKLEKKLQQFRSRDGGPDTGGTLKIYGESLCRDVPYKTLLLSIRDCAQAVVREMLAKYGMDKVDPLHYCLVQVNSDGSEYILDDDECPLSILMNHPTSRGPSCPTGTTCVRPLRCDAVMQLYWKNLTLAMEMGPNWEIGSPLAALPSPLDVAFQRCWIFTEASGRSHHEGVCCQLEEPRELRPSDVGYVENNALLMFDPDDDVEKEDDESQGQVTEDEQQQQLSNDIEQDWRKSNIRKSSIPDYERLIGLSSNESHIRTKRCLIGPECTVKDHRYRRFNGRCNNIHPGRSLWGSAGYPMERLLPPAYNNGVSSSRMLSNDGRYLPSSRVVSDNMFSDLHIPHRRHNVLMMQLGQFLVHDISRNKATPINSKCCLPDNSHRNPHPHPACSPIRVSSKDSFYSQFNVKCLNFVRTVMAPLNQCHVGHGRQISEVTHFIDGSMIYGSSKQEADELRAHQGGRLKSLQHRQSLNELPPLDAPYVCTSAAKACFKAGDTRVNQVLTLVGFHTLFLREHNRIARKLEKINPHWSDDILFHETRRIVAAEFQHIIYNEYLPKVVGPDFMEMYDLHTSQGYSNFYNPEKNPALTSEFTTAAFRFGHSTVPGQFELPHGIINTHETFFNPSAITEPKFFDELFHGIMQQPMQKVDDMFTHSLTRFLNPEGGKSYGLDLAAINIQRGKDHAIRPYNYYLQLSGREVMRSFADFGPVHGPKLASLYSTPDDVDLYVGGILEQPVSGGVVGQTFAEIISDQFARLKQGDRYFYSNGRLSNPGHFTKPQLQELQKTTMAGIICANVNDKNSFEVALEALNLPHANKNPLVSCRSAEVPHLNLKWWRD